MKDRNYGIIIFIFAKYFVLRRHKIFADIIKASTILNQARLKDSIKVKGIKSLVLKCNLY